jgi:hypothetical protein
MDSDRKIISKMMVMHVGRAGQNARGSSARSVRGQLGSARIGSFEFFRELS